MRKRETATPANQANRSSKSSKEKRERIVNIVVNVLLVIVIVMALVCTYTSYVTKKGSGVPSLFGYIPLAIQSDSMKGLFEEGDLVISKVVDDASTLQEKDVITFWTIINGQRVLNTHRIIKINDGGTHLSFTTKGDYNTINDSLAVHESEVVGVYQTHIPGLGSVLDFLQTSKGFFLVVVLPVFAFFAYYVVAFFRALFAYQARKTRESIESERAAQSEGMVQMSQEQLQEMMAKILAEASKQNTAPEQPGNAAGAVQNTENEG